MQGRQGRKASRESMVKRIRMVITRVSGSNGILEQFRTTSQILPDNWQRLDLHKILARFGKVRDIYIAKKSNKEGKRFGFARFVEVADVRQLENRLQNIWIGDMRKAVNLPKFQTKSIFQVRSRRFIPGQSHQGFRVAKSYVEICKGPQLAEKVEDHRVNAKTTTSDGVEKWLGM